MALFDPKKYYLAYITKEGDTIFPAQKNNFTKSKLDMNAFLLLSKMPSVDVEGILVYRGEFGVGRLSMVETTSLLELFSQWPRLQYIRMTNIRGEEKFIPKNKIRTHRN